VAPPSKPPLAASRSWNSSGTLNGAVQITPGRVQKVPDVPID
jgi:hypothetical protein